MVGPKIAEGTTPLGSLIEPTAESLPVAEQERLAEILDAYLVSIERGSPILPSELLAQHPADAEYLRLYLSGLELFHAAAAPGKSALVAAEMTLVGERGAADWRVLDRARDWPRGDGRRLRSGAAGPSAAGGAEGVAAIGG